MIGYVGRKKALRPAGLVMMPFVRRMRLGTLARLSGRRICIPSAGYPAIALSGTTVAENLTNGEVMFESLAAAIDEFGLEADGTVSDLTIEPEACGCEVSLPDHDTPFVRDHPFAAGMDIGALEVPDPMRARRMRAMIDAVAMMSKRFTLPTVAGGSGPFTLAAELMGASEAAMCTITDKDFMHELLAWCTSVCTVYLKALRAAGADVVLIGEPTAVILSPDSFGKFAREPLKSVSSNIRAGGGFPVLHICGDSTHLLEGMVATGVDGLSLDSPVDMGAALDAAGDDVVVIGNVDPVGTMLEGDPAAVAEAARKLLGKFGDRPNYVLGTGCDLPIETPLENIDALMAAGGTTFN